MRQRKITNGLEYSSHLNVIIEERLSFFRSLFSECDNGQFPIFFVQLFCLHIIFFFHYFITMLKEWQRFSIFMQTRCESFTGSGSSSCRIHADGFNLEFLGNHILFWIDCFCQIQSTEGRIRMGTLELNLKSDNTRGNMYFECM